jgi:cytochrome c-type biogenesis protein CcmE
MTSKRYKTRTWNQAGIACTVSDSATIAIKSVDETISFVAMPDDWFEAGKEARLQDGGELKQIIANTIENSIKNI